MRLSSSACREDGLSAHFYEEDDVGGRFKPGHGVYHLSHSTAFARSRSAYFWILPVEVFGSGPNTMVFGAL